MLLLLDWDKAMDDGPHMEQRVSPIATVQQVCFTAETKERSKHEKYSIIS